MPAGREPELGIKVRVDPVIKDREVKRVVEANADKNRPEIDIKITNEQAKKALRESGIIDIPVQFKNVSFASDAIQKCLGQVEILRDYLSDINISISQQSLNDVKESVNNILKSVTIDLPNSLRLPSKIVDINGITKEQHGNLSNSAKAIDILNAKASQYASNWKDIQTKIGTATKQFAELMYVQKPGEYTNIFGSIEEYADEVFGKEDYLVNKSTFKNAIVKWANSLLKAANDEFDSGVFNTAMKMWSSLSDAVSQVDASILPEDLKQNMDNIRQMFGGVDAGGFGGTETVNQFLLSQLQTMAQYQKEVGMSAKDAAEQVSNADTAMVQAGEAAANAIPTEVFAALEKQAGIIRDKKEKTDDLVLSIDNLISKENELAKTITASGVIDKIREQRDAIREKQDASSKVAVGPNKGSNSQIEAYIQNIGAAANINQYFAQELQNSNQYLSEQRQLMRDVVDSARTYVALMGKTSPAAAAAAQQKAMYDAQNQEAKQRTKQTNADAAQIKADSNKKKAKDDAANREEQQRMKQQKLADDAANQAARQQIKQKNIATAQKNANTAQINADIREANAQRRAQELDRKQADEVRAVVPIDRLKKYAVSAEVNSLQLERSFLTKGVYGQINGMSNALNSLLGTIPENVGNADVFKKWANNANVKNIIENLGVDISGIETFNELVDEINKQLDGLIDIAKLEKQRAAKDNAVLSANRQTAGLSHRANTYYENNTAIKRDKDLDARFKVFLNELDQNDSFENIKQFEERYAQLIKETNVKGLEKAGVIKDFKDLFQEHFKTAIIMGAVHFLNNALRQVYRTVAQVNAAMTQLKIVTNANSQEMKEYAKSAISAAREVSSSMVDILNSATTYARLGYKGDTAIDLAKYTAMYSNTSGSTVEDATTALTSILKGYQKDENEAKKILSEMVKVGNSFAVSSSELGVGLANAGSALANTGNTLEESIGILAAANASVQNISVASTAVRTMTMRLTGTKGELTTALEEGLDVQDAIENQSKYRDEIFAETNGIIDILEEDGKTYKNFFTIMSELSRIWGDLDADAQAVIREDIAGTRGGNVFNSMITNWKDASSAAEMAKSAYNELETANAKYLDSIEGKVNQLSAAWDDFSYNFLNSEIVKLGVDIATSSINTLDALNKIYVLLPMIVSTLYIWAKVQKAIRDKIELTALLTKSNFINLGAVAAAALAIQAAIKIYDHFVSTLSKTEQLQKVTSELQSIEDKINEINERIEDNIKISASATEEQKKQLDEVNQKLSKQLSYYNSIAATKSSEVNERAYDVASEATEKSIKYYTVGSGAELVGNEVVINEGVLTPTYITKPESLAEYSEKLVELVDKYNELGSSSGNFSKRLVELQDEMKTTRNIIESLQNGVSEQAGSFQDGYESTEKYKVWMDAANNATEKAANAIDKYNVAMGYLDIETNAAAETVEKSADKFEKLNKELDNIQSGFKAVVAAQDEYNKYGYISIDTLQSLLALDSEYLACLINESGQLAINKDAYQEMTKKQLENAEAAAILQAIEELKAVATVDSAIATATATQATVEQAKVLSALVPALDDATVSTMEFATAQALLDAYDSARNKNGVEAQRIMDNLNAKLTLIKATSDRVGKSTTGLGNALNGMSDAASKAKDALDQLNKKKEKYEKTVKAVVGTIDKEIEKLEDEKKALNDEDVPDSYAARIKAIQDQIDELNKTNDAIEKQLALEKSLADFEAAQRNKTKRVYREGQGFVWEVDADAIKDASEAIDKAKFDLQIAELEKQKEALENALADEEKAIDKQIEKLEEYKNKWNEIESDYEDIQNQMIAAQLLGLDWQEKILGQDIELWSGFKDDYFVLLDEIQRKTEEVAAATAAAASRIYAPGGSAPSGDAPKKTTSSGVSTIYKPALTVGENGNRVYNQWLKDKKDNILDDYLIDVIDPNLKYASGSAHIPFDQIANVDERGRELIIRKPNAGRYTYLETGDGVVPADITSRLFEIGGNPYRWFAEQFHRIAGATMISHTPDFGNNFTIGDIVITNPVSDVDALAREIKQNLPLTLKQNLSKRR